MGRINLWIVCGVLLVGSLSASSAHAQFGMGGGGSLGMGFGYYNYGQTQQRIPYYALYPPVYYSHPVPRTYGYSPFAYPPGVLTPDVESPVEAAEYRNPLVPKSGRPQPANDQTAAVAKTFYNPFVPQARTASK